MRAILKAFFFGLVFCPSASFATVLINPPSPYPQVTTFAAGNQIAFADGDHGALNSGAFVNESAGYKMIDADPAPTPGNDLIYLNVSSTTTAFGQTGSQQVVVTLSTATSAGSEIPLTGASTFNGSYPPSACNSSGTITCYNRNGTNTPVSALYTTGTTMTLSFSLSALCATASVGTSMCPSAMPSPSDSSTETQTIYVTFSVADPNSSTPGNQIGSTGTALISGTQVDSSNFVLALTDQPPAISAPTSGNLQDYYYPGESSILITADNYSPSINGGVALQNLVVFADRTRTVAELTVSSNTTLPTAEVPVGYINYTGANQVISGFQDTTTCTPTCNNGYNGVIYAMNSAGIFSDTQVTTATFPTAGGQIDADGLFHAEAIQSVLTKSRCFIATAAFHDGDAAPVVMLRHFRDQVLSRSAWGREFIHSYYHYSPALAEWAWDKPFIRSIALHALAPVEFMAWAILKLTHAEQLDTTQPYIDRVKKKLDEAQPNPTPEESYTEALKKKLAPSPAPGDETYIERLKRQLPPQNEESKDYSKNLKETLPPEDDNESAIARIKEGRDHPHTKPPPPISTGFSLKFGVSPGLTVNNTDSASTVKFQDMYGNGGSWQPDLGLHYEHQLFHSEALGSFGIGGDLGVSYAEGYGRYTFSFGNPASYVSQTKFSFLQIPVAFTGVYRFNLFRIVRPYAGGGLGTMLYDELRHDGNPDKRGYSFIYEAMVGLAIKIDGLDTSTSRDGYLSTGIQHSYMYIEYFYMNTLASPVVFGRNGIYLGFLFEY